MVPISMILAIYYSGFGRLTGVLMSRGKLFVHQLLAVQSSQYFINLSICVVLHYFHFISSVRIIAFFFKKL